MSYFTRYIMEIECLLTWYPLRTSARLKMPVLRSHSSKYVSDDPGWNGGLTAKGVTISSGLNPDKEDPLSGDVLAILETRVDTDEIFFVEIDAMIGRTSRRQRVVCRPGVATPVLINVSASMNDEALKDTALTVQCVLTSGPRASLSSIVANNLLSGLSSR